MNYNSYFNNVRLIGIMTVEVYDLQLYFKNPHSDNELGFEAYRGDALILDIVEECFFLFYQMNDISKGIELHPEKAWVEL